MWDKDDDKIFSLSNWEDEVYITEMGKCGRKFWGEIAFDHVKFKMSIRYSSGNAKLTVGYISLLFGQDGDIKLREVSVHICVCKSMTQGTISPRVRRRVGRSKDYALEILGKTNKGD